MENAGICASGVDKDKVIHNQKACIFGNSKLCTELSTLSTVEYPRISTG